jgi:hypothetical protein
LLEHERETRVEEFRRRFGEPRTGFSRIRIDPQGFRKLLLTVGKSAFGVISCTKAVVPGKLIRPGLNGLLVFLYGFETLSLLPERRPQTIPRERVPGF